MINIQSKFCRVVLKLSLNTIIVVAQPESPTGGGGGVRQRISCVAASSPHLGFLLLPQKPTNHELWNLLLFSNVYTKVGYSRVNSGSISAYHNFLAFV